MRSDSVFLSVWVSRARACDQMKMLIVVSVSALLSLSLSLSPPSPHSIARSLARLSVARVGSRFAADERVRTARGPLLLRGRPGGSGPGRPSLRPSVPSPLSSPFLLADNCDEKVEIRSSRYLWCHCGMGNIDIY